MADGMESSGGWNWDWLSNPNIQQYMGGVGSQLSAGMPAGVALDPSRMIRQTQLQQALGGKPWAGMNSAAPNVTAAPTAPQTGKVSDLSKMDFGFLNNLVTPMGQKGIDSFTQTTTADGTKYNFTVPSERNLNTYGTSVPPESIPATQNGGVSDQRPFWKTLLG
jgi:hypothetical protein